MSDPVGTVRREEHDGGHSTWVQVSTQIDGEYWLCVWSASPGKLGYDWSGNFPGAIEDVTTVIGAVPGTPAAAESEGRRSARSRR